MMPTGWAMSIENMIKQIFNSKLRGRTPFYSILVLLTLPLVFIEKIISKGYGSIMDFEIKKIDE